MEEAESTNISKFCTNESQLKFQEEIINIINERLREVDNERMKIEMDERQKINNEFGVNLSTIVSDIK